jgi:hypothetical protein
MLSPRDWCHTADPSLDHLVGERERHRRQRGGIEQNVSKCGKPALVLPLQRGTVLNQTLPLNQSTGTNQRIGFGPANAGTSMRPQSLIGKRL